MARARSARHRAGRREERQDLDLVGRRHERRTRDRNLRGAEADTSSVWPERRNESAALCRLVHRSARRRQNHAPPRSLRFQRERRLERRVRGAQARPEADAPSTFVYAYAIVFGAERERASELVTAASSAISTSSRS